MASVSHRKLVTKWWSLLKNELKEVVGIVQSRHFTSEDELNFDLEEFLDFNKVPGLDDSSLDDSPSEISTRSRKPKPEVSVPDLTWKWWF